MQAVWAKREEGRYGAIVEPLLQYAKTRTAEQKRQVVPCRAGTLNAVVYANGDVSVCENHRRSATCGENTFRANLEFARGATAAEFYRGRGLLLHQ